LGCFDLVDGMKRLSLPVVKGAISDSVGIFCIVLYKIHISQSLNRK